MFLAVDYLMDISEFVASSAERMANLLSFIGPEVDQLTFLGLRLQIFHTAEISPENKQVIFNGINQSFNETCRGNIFQDYLPDAFKKSDIIIVIFLENAVQAFILFSYDVKTRSGFINLVCSKKEPVSLGSFLLCITHQYLFNAGFPAVYVDAANDAVASYYESLGYTYGFEQCGEPDEISEQHQDYRDSDPDANEFFEFLPDDYLTDQGYRMKMCGNFGQICIKAYKNLEKALNKVAS